MSDFAIRVKDLKKEFVVSHSGIASLKTLLVWWKRRAMVKLDVLKGVDIDVKRGECVAIVGKNGAGKSTLLSLLARIYKPTSGTMEVNGRVAPLLELGAGFHPDLTGIENVYFNAVILGLSREEVKKRLPDIIAFSELGSAVEAPVRTFSSGMQARLGFSIAVHVDADILIVDEVLAVGDQHFKKKCLDRVQQFREQGGTILLVSHELESVLDFADRCVWLENGVVRMTGTPQEIIPIYEKEG